MPPRERRYAWEWWFDAPPARVWPLVSDTDRVNRLAGLPGATYARSSAPGREHVLDVRQTFYGLVPVTYQEDPFEWVEEGRFQVERRFSKGPLARLRVDGRLHPDPRGTRVALELAATPRSAISALLVPTLMRKARRGHDRAYAILQREAAGSAPPAAPHSRVARKVLERLARAGTAIPEPLAARLASHVAASEAGDLRRMRPFALADRWGAPRPEVLSACLHAVRAGALDLAFDSLCPHCRGAPRSVRSLAEVRGAARCEGCGLDFEVELDRNLEAVFRPAADLRRVPTETFCLGGPGTTPHVVAQVRLAPGAAATLAPTLEAGSYRLRAPRTAGSALLRVDADAAPGPVPVEASAAGVRLPAAAAARAGPVSLRVTNGGAAEAVVLLERVRWLDDVATALDVVAVPGFRDLFAEEVLSPGERVAVRRIAILFTDLRGSTALRHRRRGGVRARPRAPRRSGRHPARRAARQDDRGRRDGGIPRARAVARPRHHRRMAAMVPRGAWALVLKAGIHSGPSIAVNTGGRLDFFGTTTNLAPARSTRGGRRRAVVTEECSPTGRPPSPRSPTATDLRRDAEGLRRAVPSIACISPARLTARPAPEVPMSRRRPSALPPSRSRGALRCAPHRPRARTVRPSRPRRRPPPPPRSPRRLRPGRSRRATSRRGSSPRARSTGSPRSRASSSAAAA
jgi:hypothetical protein